MSYLIANQSTVFYKEDICVFLHNIGMKRKRLKDVIDISGKKFGELTVIERIFDYKRRGVHWRCVCDCGKETLAYGGHLRAEKRVSCGCRSEKYIFRTGIEKLFSMYKSKAKKRGIQFALIKDEFQRLVTSSCFYCQKDPSQILKRQKSKKIQIKYNGIDRKDSSYGYFTENCVSCCRICNQSKSNLSFKDWKSHILRLAKCLRTLT